MMIDIKLCDINNDYFHFTNKRNVDSILNSGLIPQVGTASKVVNDRPNVAITKGAKGIIGVINAFIYKLETGLKISQIPVEYRKYFTEITDFSKDEAISPTLACKAIKRKLSDEVYFRVRPTEQKLKKARIGGSTGYDITLEEPIGKDQLDIVTNSNNEALTALDVARLVYERAKDKAILREMYPEFFRMFELDERQVSQDEKSDIEI